MSNYSLSKYNEYKGDGENLQEYNCYALKGSISEQNSSRAMAVAQQVVA